ncbi:MAG: DUF4266 domain-containing protein [Gammaproteobacteria bacterium]|nr:DUF4266 domain-containing protein [Gammaproteobacteria bacterium]
MSLLAYRPCRHLLMTLIVAVLLCSCGLKPWVQPYERENFADPVMSLSRNPIADRYRQHVMEVREGARGASVTQGGGCGCN